MAFLSRGWGRCLVRHVTTRTAQEKERPIMNKEIGMVTSRNGKRSYASCYFDPPPTSFRPILFHQIKAAAPPPSRTSPIVAKAAGTGVPRRWEWGWAAALAFGLALVLGAGEAAAQTNLCGGDVVTGRTSIITCNRAVGSMTDVHIDVRTPDITTTSFNTDPITTDDRGAGSITIDVTGGSLTAEGAWSKGIRTWLLGPSGDVAITLKDVDIKTDGFQGQAIFVYRQSGAGDIKIDVSGGSITTTKDVGQGILGWLAGSGAVDIDAKNVVIKTDGANALAVFGYRTGAMGNVDVDVRGGSVETNGFLAHGVFGGGVGGTGEIDVSVADASVTTRGRFTRAITGVLSGQGDIAVDVSGNTIVTAEGEGGVGVYAAHSGTGSLDTTISAGTRITVPFANGVHGRMLASANAAGRIVITHEGDIEARDTGILAWAEPESGSTFGAGTQAADDERATPIIHVTSSGDITVGEGVMDAYIRAAIAGDDETLSAAEKSVLDAITAGDSDALNTALAALPTSYTDDWKTRARAFLSARGAKPTDRHGVSGQAPATSARLAEEAAVEILDIPRAGIRAMALSHVTIADHVRSGDVDPALTAIEEASRTEMQKATLAAQQLLSAAERTVLEVMLKGGDLETALGALPATYTDDWKNEVRRLAQSYNAGDIRVDVTGGTITAEGDGVHARYALTHDQNGAIAVTVAEGASVSGERHGIYVGGAGVAAGSDNLRAQRVTVTGTVMGGTGAGVHLTGGGRLIVGRTGRVGASSGVGVLADGPGDFHATVAGVVQGDIRSTGDGDLSATISGTVQGDIRALGDGDLTATVTGTVDGDVEGLGGGEHVVTVPLGGTITGTVHLAGSTVTVGGTVGRVTLDNSGMVVIAQTGRVTGGTEGGVGVQVGDNGHIENRGTIEDKVGISAGPGSTVVNFGTIRSTDGADGIAVDFPEAGANTLTLKQGMMIDGKIRGLTGDDTVDLSDLDVNEVGILTFVDENGTPVTPADIRRPTRGIGRLIDAGGALVPLDTTAFALTDDMLSDLTGSIHAAVLGIGLPTRTREGTPARGHVWATPFGGTRNQGGVDTLADGTHSFGGGLLGAGWGGNALHVGGFIGGSTGRLDVDNRQDVDVQTVFGGVYTQQVLGTLLLDARLLLGHMEHDSTRWVGRSTANAEYTSVFFSPEVGLATRVQLTNKRHVTPRVRVRYAGLFTRSFRERAAGTNWDLQFAERDVHVLEVRGEVGLPIALEGGGRLEPRVGLEGRWLLAGEMVEATVPTVPGSAFRIAAGGHTNVGTGSVGLGMVLPVADATNLVGNFDGALTTEHAWRATGYLGLTYSF